jgi:hypothetical protein
VRGFIVRFLAIAAVLGGIVFPGAGVAAAAADRPVGGDKATTPSCDPANVDLANGCFFGVGRFFT